MIEKDYSVDTMLANKRKIMECIAHLLGQTSLKEYAHKDYLSSQKEGVGETNISQQIL